MAVQPSSSSAPLQGRHHRIMLVPIYLLTLLLLSSTIRLSHAFVMPIPSGLVRLNHNHRHQPQPSSSSSVSSTTSSTRRNVLRDYHNNNNNNLDDIDMDRWINSLMEQLQDFSRYQLQHELQLVEGQTLSSDTRRHNSNPNRDHYASGRTGNGSNRAPSSLTREELVYRILKARLQMAALAEQRLEDTFHNSVGHVDDKNNDGFIPHQEHSPRHSAASSSSATSPPPSPPNIVIHEEDEPIIYSASSTWSSKPSGQSSSSSTPFFARQQPAQPPRQQYDVDHRTDHDQHYSTTPSSPFDNDDYDVEPVISSVDIDTTDDGQKLSSSYSSNDNGRSFTPTTDHWSTKTTYNTNKKNAAVAISLNDYDDSRRERHAFYAAQQRQQSSHNGNNINNGNGRFGTPGSKSNSNNNNVRANDGDLPTTDTNDYNSRFQAAPGWHEQPKKRSPSSPSSSFTSTNHFVIDDITDDDIDTTGHRSHQSSFPDHPDENSQRRTRHNYYYDDNDMPVPIRPPTPSSDDMHNNNDNIDPVTGLPRRASRARYTPNSHPKTNSHETSSTTSSHNRRTIFTDPVAQKPQPQQQDDGVRRRRRTPQIVELPMSIVEGIPTVQLRYQTSTTTGHPSTTMTTFVIDTGRYQSTIPNVVGSGRNTNIQLHQQKPQRHDETDHHQATTPGRLKSANDDVTPAVESSPSFMMLSPSSPSSSSSRNNNKDSIDNNDIDDDSIDMPFLLSAFAGAGDDLSATGPPDDDNNNNPWLLPEPPVIPAAATVKKADGIRLDGFYTNRGIFIQTDQLDVEYMDPEEQMLSSSIPHGCLGMDVLGSFDTIEMDFDNHIVRLSSIGGSVDDDDNNNNGGVVIAEAAMTSLPIVDHHDRPPHELYTLPLRVDGRGPANMLISTALPTTVLTWKGVNDALGLSRHSNEITDIDGTFSPHSTVASHFTHHLHVNRKLDFGIGRRINVMNPYDVSSSTPPLPGLSSTIGMAIPVGQFPTNIGHNEHLNRAFERKRTGGLIGMDILSQCSILKFSFDRRIMKVQMLTRRPSSSSSLSQWQHRGSGGNGGGGTLRP